jgi:antirestriction protein
MSKNNVELKICLGCYASYNDGFLFDTWYTVTDSVDLSHAVDEFQAHVMESIKKARPDWEASGYIQETYAEEVYISDSELYVDGEFIKYDFSECLSAAESLLDALDQTFNNDLALLFQVADNNGTDLDGLSKLDDDLFAFQVDSDSDYDIGYTYAEITDALNEMPDHLKPYFDYESYGRDLYATTYNVNGTYYAVIDN